MGRRNRESNHRKRDWLAVAALVIALFGGVPGIIGVVDYFKRSSIAIRFDPNNSLACRINSRNAAIKGKIAVLLYRVTITGSGLQPSYLREMKLSLRVDGEWKNGTQFMPTQKDETDKESVTKKAVHIRLEKTKDNDDLFIAGWENFRPGEKGLGYGEPSHFSYAAHFDVHPGELSKCQELRIVVTDYLGNEYKETVECSPFIARYSRLLLMQD